MFTVGLDTSALDPKFKSHAERGIGRYVSELSKFFTDYQASAQKKLSVEYFNQLDYFSGRITAPLLKSLPAGVNTVRQQLLFPMQLSAGRGRKFDGIHFPAHMDAPAWGMKSYALTVLDLIPLVLKNLYQPEKGNFRFHFARWLEIRAIKNASLILAISEHTGKDVHRILGVPEERIIVTPLGVDQKFFSSALLESESTVRARYKIPDARPILLYVGGIDQRKNYSGLVRTFQQVLQTRIEQRKSPPLLVMAGRIQTDRQYPKLLEVIKREQVEDSVILAGFVPDNDLLQLYALSALFVFPSLYEGFGLPPLEAMAAGLPVVSSNASSLPEVIGDCGVLVDPLNYQQFAHEILSLLEDAPRRNLYAERGRKRAAQFPWKRTGELTLAAYERMARGKV
jgi:glycosyltransferase involved in cell wall biosynthesis